MRKALATSFLGAALTLAALSALAMDIEPIRLPKPDTSGGRPLMQCLKDRRSERQYSAQKLPMETLSSLLWAAFGINRPDAGKRTAPSAHNWQEIDVYVALEEGLYLYNPERHSLEPVLVDDIRAATGLQPFVADAPVNLVYVADLSRMGKDQDDETKEAYAGMDAGFVSQNVYLFCASEGLATVVRGWVDRDKLAEVMGLADDQRVILAQTVGYPGQANPEEGE
jgi:SagB-type dehydrogenase family enzyme